MNKIIKIVDKYMFSQILTPVLVCLFLSVIVWIAPEILLKIVRQIFMDHIGLYQAGINLVCEIPKVLSMVIPISILVGCVYAFDTLSKNSELIIIRGSGIPFSRLVRPAIVIGTIFMVACYIIGDKFIPYAAFIQKEDFYYNEHFVYIEKDDQDRPKQGVIISNYTPGEIKNLTVINFFEDKEQDIVKFDSIITSKYALKEKDKWVLPEATLYKIDKEGVYEKVENIKNYEILKGTLSDEVYELMKNDTKRERVFNVKQMAKYIELLKKHEYTDKYNYLLTKMYQRFLHPITCILFAIMGCLLGYAPPRSQRMIGFLIAAAILFGYYITLPFFDVLAEKGVMPPFITAILPMVIFCFVIYFTKKIKDL